MILDSKTIEKLKTEHGPNLHKLRAPGGGEVVVARVPTREEWRRFKANIADKAKRSQAGEALVRDCVVFPERAEFDAMLSARPGLAEAFGDKLGELAGAMEEVEAEKL